MSVVFTKTGIRSVAGKYPLEPESLVRLGMVIAKVFGEKSQDFVVTSLIIIQYVGSDKGVANFFYANFAPLFQTLSSFRNFQKLLVFFPQKIYNIYRLQFRIVASFDNGVNRYTKVLTAQAERRRKACFILEWI